MKSIAPPAEPTGSPGSAAQAASCPIGRSSWSAKHRMTPSPGRRRGPTRESTFNNSRFTLQNCRYRDTSLPVDHPRKFHKLMRWRSRPDVPDRDTARHQGIGDQLSVAPPPVGLSARHHAAVQRVLRQRRQRRSERGRLHVGLNFVDFVLSSVCYFRGVRVKPPRNRRLTGWPPHAAASRAARQTDRSAVRRTCARVLPPAPRSLGG